MYLPFCADSDNDTKYLEFLVIESELDTGIGICKFGRDLLHTYNEVQLSLFKKKIMSETAQSIQTPFLSPCNCYFWHRTTTFEC